MQAQRLILSYPYPLLYHLKMPLSLFNSTNFFLRTSRLSTILRFRLVVILSFYNSMLLLYLSNVQISYMKTIVLLHPILYFFIRSLRLNTRSINLIQIDFYFYVIIRLLLEQKNNRLNMGRIASRDNSICIICVGKSQKPLPMNERCSNVPSRLT